MAELKGTQVAAAIVPFTDQDNYATHDAQYGKGGFRSVATNALRDAIPASRKEKGMVVFVTDTGLHWWWNGSSWVEWKPKGSMEVDATLSTTSSNPVQNRVITTELNSVKTLASNAIPKANIDTTKPDSPTNSNVPSSALFVSEINSVSSTAGSALIAANNAIPKTYIDDTMPENPVATRVPSTKLLGTVSAIANTAKNTADSAMTAANSAGSIASAAVPKSWVVTAINSGNSTSTTLVPSVKAVYDYIATSHSTLIDIINAASTKAQSALDLANAAIPKSKIVTTLSNQTDNSLVPSAPSVIKLVQDEADSLAGSINHTNTRVQTLETWRLYVGSKNVANGFAGLDSNGKISPNQLPAGYDNIDKLVAFVTNAPTSGMTIGQKWYITSTKKIFTATSATSGVSTDPSGDDLIYIDQNANKSYYWSGSNMVNIGSGNALALGTTHSTAFYGDYGNTLYTNFGSGTNLTYTQRARNFFGGINVNSDRYFQDIDKESNASSFSLIFGSRLFNASTTDASIVSIDPVSTTNAGIMTADMFNTLKELEAATFPIQLALGGGGTFEIGSSTKPVMSITASKKGSDITPSCSIVVQPSPSVSGSLSSDKRTWTASSNITATTNIAVTATFDGKSVNKSLIYYFKYKKYWGVSSSSSLTSEQIIALGSSTWADTGLMGATTFSCSGGKYPYYVLPNEVASGIEFWVGGLKNTDVVSESIMLTNASGARHTYMIYRLANIQTGTLSIEFKYIY